jgi:hypothetical protein
MTLRPVMIRRRSRDQRDQATLSVPIVDRVKVTKGQAKVDD